MARLCNLHALTGEQAEYNYVSPSEPANSQGRGYDN